MNTLDQIALKNKTDKASSHHGYTELYAQLFEPFRVLPITLVEIGVQFGNSINTWLEYFTQAKIHGIDIVQDFKSPDPRFTFWQGSQDNPAFLNDFVAKVKSAEIIIDDGCHHSQSQVASFNHLWPMVKSGGLYIIEDTFTMFDPTYPNTISGPKWLMGLIGDLNWNAKQYHGKTSPGGVVTDFEKSLASITLQKGLVVIRKT